ncbi:MULTISPECIES: hypothetical protein [unclassified Luteococcus]
MGKRKALRRKLLKRIRQIEKQLDPSYATHEAEAIAHLARARRDLK